MIATAIGLFLPAQSATSQTQPAPVPQGTLAETVQPDGVSPSVQAFDDWRVSCATPEADSCRVWQRVQVVAGEIVQDVMSVSLAPSGDTDSGLVVVIQTPLDIYLPNDFALRIDGAGERKARFRNCDATGCWVVMPVDLALLRDLRGGLQAEAAFSLTALEVVRISFSLRGVTAALAAYKTEREARV